MVYSELSRFRELLVVLTCSKLIKQFEVAFDCTKKRLVLVIRNAKLLCSFLYDEGDFSIMDMANIRKQMMLNLVVKPTDQPGEKLTAFSEVSSCLHLMNCPVVLHVSIFITYKKVSFFDDMSGLENQCEH